MAEEWLNDGIQVTWQTVEYCTPRAVRCHGEHEQ